MSRSGCATVARRFPLNKFRGCSRRFVAAIGAPPAWAWVCSSCARSCAHTKARSTWPRRRKEPSSRSGCRVSRELSELDVPRVPLVLVGCRVRVGHVGGGHLKEVSEAGRACAVPVIRLDRVERQQAEIRVVLAVRKPDLPRFGPELVDESPVA